MGHKATEPIRLPHCIDLCSDSHAFVCGLQNPAVQIVGLQPEGAASIPGLVK